MVNNTPEAVTWEYAEMSYEKGIALALAAAALLPAQALAADYDPPIYVDQAPEYTPVEVGSGWYLRGDISYMPGRVFRDESVTLSPVRFDADDSPFYGSIGAGYHFNDYLRAELNFGYLPGNKLDMNYNDGTVAAAGSLNNHAWTGIVNGYVDLGTYVGLTPYIGAGVGLYGSSRSIDLTYSDATGTTAFSDHKNQYSFAYTLNAGVAYQLSKNIQLDLGYQYLSAPDAEIAEIRDFTSYPIHKGIDAHQIKVGLRYDLW